MCPFWTQGDDLREIDLKLIDFGLSLDLSIFFLLFHAISYKIIFI